MTIIYTVWYEIEADAADIAPKFIGVYSTRENAEKAVAYLSQKRGFKDGPEHFNIYRSPLNLTSWEEGFVREPDDDDQ